MKIFFLSLCCACLFYMAALADDFLAPKQKNFEGFETTLHEKGTEVTLTQQYTGLTNNQGHTHGTTLAANHHGAHYGVHGELARIHSQERAYQFKAGFSFSMTDCISAKLEVGSSTKNKHISPEKFGALSIETHAFDRKMMFIPLFERKIYRNGIKTYSMALDSIYYSDTVNSAGCYWATQLHLKNTSPTLTRFQSTGVGLGTSYISPQKYTLGIYGEAGSTYYENLDNLNHRNYSYYLIRPTVDIYLTENMLLLLKTTFQRTKFYDAKEVLASLKWKLDSTP